MLGCKHTLQCNCKLFCIECTVDSHLLEAQHCLVFVEKLVVHSLIKSCMHHSTSVYIYRCPVSYYISSFNI